MLIIQISSVLFANEIYDKLDINNFSNSESRWIQKKSGCLFALILRKEQPDKKGILKTLN